MPDMRTQFKHSLTTVNEVPTDEQVSEPGDASRSVPGAIDCGGLVPRHAEALLRFSQENNCIVAFRPVSKFATSLIEEGMPTKGFHIKGKSADQGPQAGFICVDQSLSKLADGQRRDFTAANNNVAASIRDGHAVAIPLVISHARLTELRMLGAIEAGLPNKEGLVILKSPSSPREKEAQRFEARPLKNSDKFAIFVTRSGHAEAVQVLASPRNGKPITADYDLLLHAIPLSDLGPEDRLPIPEVTHERFKQRFGRDGASLRSLSSGDLRISPKRQEMAALRREYDSPAAFYGREDPDIGNASARVRELIPRLNRAMMLDEGQEVVHHSVDSANPFSDPDSNYPATVILPRQLGRFNPICTVSNADELVELLSTAKDAGYHTATNPLWGADLARHRRPRFENARAQIALHLSAERKHGLPIEATRSAELSGAGEASQKRGLPEAEVRLTPSMK